MTTVKELYVYPLKSARGIPQQSVRLTRTGFEWDRHWMAIDATDCFVSQRTHPQLARIQPSLDAQALTLRAEGFPALRVPFDAGGPTLTVRVWKDLCTVQDAGTEAGEWLSEVSGDALRLVRIGRSMRRGADPAFAGPDSHPVTFVDGYPLLICNSASLDELNARMPAPVPIARFRPNIVLDGLPAFAEDRIAALRIGNVTLRLVKPCTRCVITATDQQTGERSINPLPVLRQFRFNRGLLGVTFGENAVIAAGSGHTISRGTRCAARMEEAAPAASDPASGQR